MLPKTEVTFRNPCARRARARTVFFCRRSVQLSRARAPEPGKRGSIPAGARAAKPHGGDGRDRARLWRPTCERACPFASRTARRGARTSACCRPSKGTLCSAESTWFFVDAPCRAGTVRRDPASWRVPKPISCRSQHSADMSLRARRTPWRPPDLFDLFERAGRERARGRYFSCGERSVRADRSAGGQTGPLRCPRTGARRRRRTAHLAPRTRPRSVLRGRPPPCKIKVKCTQ